MASLSARDHRPLPRQAPRSARLPLGLLVAAGLVLSACSSGSSAAPPNASGSRPPASQPSGAAALPSGPTLGPGPAPTEPASPGPRPTAVPSAGGGEQTEFCRTAAQEQAELAAVVDPSLPREEVPGRATATRATHQRLIDTAPAGLRPDVETVVRLSLQVVDVVEGGKTVAQLPPDLTAELTSPAYQESAKRFGDYLTDVCRLKI